MFSHHYWVQEISRFWTTQTNPYSTYNITFPLILMNIKFVSVRFYILLNAWYKLSGTEYSCTWSRLGRCAWFLSLFFFSYHTAIRHFLIHFHDVVDLLHGLTLRVRWAPNSVWSYVIMQRYMLIFQVKSKKEDPFHVHINSNTRSPERGTGCSCPDSCTQLSHDSHLGFFDIYYSQM